MNEEEELNIFNYILTTEKCSSFSLKENPCKQTKRRGKKKQYE